MPGHALLEALAQVATSVGLSAALILFFVWQGRERERYLMQRIEGLETFQRDALVKLNERTVAALTENHQALLHNTEATTKAAVAIEQLCLTQTRLAAKLDDHDEFAREAIRRMESRHTREDHA